MKAASASQIEQLRILQKEIAASKDETTTAEKLVEVESQLKEIDFMSSFYNDFSRDMKIHQSQKVLTVQSSLVKILDDALEFYKAK